MDERHASLLGDPQIVAFLPILWVAWADGDLSERERAQIADELSRAPWLRPEARRRIAAWLDPKAPPSDRELRVLHSALERARGTLGEDRRGSLLETARAVAATDPSPEAATALAALEALLGLSDGVKSEARAPFTEVEVPTSALTAALDGSQRAVRERVRAYLDDPERRMYGLGKDEQRAMVRDWLSDLEKTGLMRLSFPGVTSDTPDLRAFMAAFETLALGDLSVVVKAGVQLGLFGGSI